MVAWLHRDLAKDTLPPFQVFLYAYRITLLETLNTTLYVNITYFMDTNILCDLWCGTGKQTHGTGKMKAGHQMMRMSGCQNQQPNLRNQPFV